LPVFCFPQTLRLVAEALYYNKKIMKVTVFPRGNKLHIRVTVNGIQQKIPTGYNNDPRGRELAEIKAREIELQYLKQEERKAQNKILLSEAYLLFITNREKRTNHTDNYKYTYNKIIELGKDLYVTSYTEDFFFEFKNTLLNKKAHNTVANYLSHARTMFNFFLKKGWIKENPVPDMSTMDMPIVIIKDSHLGKIFNALKRKDIKLYEYCKFLYLSGFRITESTTVMSEHLLFDRKKINIFNSKKNRWELFPMIRGLDTFLKPYKNIEGQLFKIRPEHATKEFSNIVTELQLPDYSLHDLRRKFGSEEARNHMPAQLMALMRHKDIRTTMKYYVEGDLDMISKISKKPGVSI
jgi:integrase